LARARADAGINKAELARRTNISKSYIGRIESGRQTPTPLTAGVLARELGVTSDWLTSGRGPMWPRQHLRPHETLAESSPSPYNSAMVGWREALEPQLAGSPLEGALAGQEERLEQGWLAMPRETRRALEVTLRDFAMAAFMIERLPPPARRELNTALERQLSAHIFSALAGRS
jgi:transcriptional regulator with XRE-family HTH domain